MNDKNSNTRPGRSRLLSIVLIALVTVLAIHVIARNSEALRFDMTDDNLYSLSAGSHEIIEKMQQEGVKPITIKLYFSATTGKSLPKFIKDFLTYERYVRSLLQEYAVASEGKIRVQVIDPLTDSDEAQDALDYGLDGKPINQHGDLFFFGLVFETQTGSKDVIPFLWPNQQETIEYEISKRIYSLLWPSRQRIGVLSGLQVLSEANNPYMAQILAAQGKNPRDSWIAMKLLEERFDVEKIDPETDHISHDDYDLVMVVHPRDMGENVLWALDEWVTTGGNALIFVDAFSLDDQPPQNPQQPWMQLQYEPSSNLDALFNAWGLERPEDQVVVDFELGITRPVSRTGGAERLVYDLVIDGQTRDQTLNTENPVLRGLNDLRFFVAGGLRPVSENGAEEGEGGSAGENGVTLTPLITTTAQGNTLEVKAGFPGSEGLVFQDLNNPAKVRDQFRPGSEPVALAYLVQGRLPPAYPQGADFPASTPPPPPGLPPGVQLPPPTDGEMIHKDPVPEEERAEATVMVFADVDFISDQVAFQNSLFGVQAANDNHRVLLNAVDTLLGAKELMKVRAKRTIRRPFTRFDEIEEQADRQTQERERNLRAEIESFQQQLQEKTSSLGQSNAALFEKQVQDEVNQLNERLLEANRELREIRKSKRAAIEAEESWVRLTTLWLTPSLVLALGLTLFVRRKRRDTHARGGQR